MAISSSDPQVAALLHAAQAGDQTAFAALYQHYSALGCPIGTVRSRLHTAHARLRGELAEDHVERGTL